MAEEVILSTIEKIDRCLLNTTEYYRKKAVEGVKNEFMLILDFLKDSVCSRNKLVNYLIDDVVELARDVREIVSIEYGYLDAVEDRLKKLKERILHMGGEAGQGASIPYPVAPRRSPNVVGLEETIKSLLHQEILSGKIWHFTQGPYLCVIEGVGGIGKTTLAKELYNHADVVAHFHHRAWVCVSGGKSYKQILMELIVQVGEGKGFELLEKMDNGSLQKMLWHYLNKKYFIVLDGADGDTCSKSIFQGLPNDKFNSLEGRMREVINEAEDILEYLVLEKPIKVYFSSSDDESRCDPSEGDKQNHELELLLEKVIEKVYLIAGKVKMLENVMEEIGLMAEEVKEIKHSSSSKDDDSSAFNSSSTAQTTVGFEYYVKGIKDRLCGEQSKLQIIPICGMGGIGKTTLARKVYEDPLIMEEFVIRVWVTVSQDYNAQRIFSRLLESLKDFNAGISAPNDEEKVRKILMLRKYLIVMDDMWSSEAWDAVKWVFPDASNGSCIVLTTRLSTVASHPDPSTKLCQMQLMDSYHSWILLKQKVFADKDYPELESIGKEIARSCNGLPLAIVVIAGLLCTVSKNPYSWQQIAKKVKSIKTKEQEQIEQILSLSYTHLPQYLRPYFLYMGSFPEDVEINVTRLIRLCVAEGFVKRPNRSNKSLEEEAEECLEDLVKRNLVMVTKRKCDGRVKSCSLHDLMRDLSIRKAHESKFLSSMDENIEEEYFLEKVKNERRVSIDPSSLAYLSSIHDSTIHTIICSRNELVKLDFVKSVRLLRVLEAELVEVNSLHAQLFDLFHLRYLAIRYNYHIPLSMLNLQNLQTIIIHRKKGTEFGVGLPCYLFLQWCMPQLRHVYFHGTIFFDDPEKTDSSLENLQTLSCVSHRSCKESILKMIPSLKKLKIDCSRGDVAYLNDLVHLHQLESLVIYAGCWLDSRPNYYKFTFPMMLKKLYLRDLKLPWNDMIVVGALPDLRVLKLKCCICVGSTWETTEGQFPKLEFLLIQSSNFKNWITESSHFPRLKRVLLDNCKSLVEIPNDIGEITTLELIEVKGKAKKSLMKSAEDIQKEQEDMGNNTLRVVCSGVDSF